MKTLKKIKRKIRKIFVNLLVFWSLTRNLVNGAPLPGADGFTPKPNYICPSKRESYSKEATAFGTHLNESPNNANFPKPNKTLFDRHLPEFDCIIEDLQIRQKFKHAKDFGVMGNGNRENYELFKDKIIEHMKDPSTVRKQGIFKQAEVTHFFNPDTGLNVMVHPEKRTFISGWLLIDAQLKNMMERGAL